jgi:ABC-type polysaccharide/polyol phosphate export permease
MGILVFSGVEFSWYWFQVFYYLFALLVLLLGISWMISSFQVFLKDTAQVVNVFLQFGFWLTPVMWNYQMLPEKYQFFLNFHPLFYIVNGYREVFLFNLPFWENLEGMAIFWGITIVILLFSVFIFKKLRPHFADVL